jgi:hypothetical protein
VRRFESCRGRPLFSAGQVERPWSAWWPTACRGSVRSAAPHRLATVRECGKDVIDERRSATDVHPVQVGVGGDEPAAVLWPPEIGGLMAEPGIGGSPPRRSRRCPPSQGLTRATCCIVDIGRPASLADLRVEGDDPRESPPDEPSPSVRTVADPGGCQPTPEGYDPRTASGAARSNRMLARTRYPRAGRTRRGPGREPGPQETIDNRGITPDRRQGWVASVSSLGPCTLRGWRVICLVAFVPSWL